MTTGQDMETIELGGSENADSEKTETDEEDPNALSSLQVNFPTWVKVA